MKKIVYIIAVLLVAIAISYSIGQFFRPYLEVATGIKDFNSLMSVADFIWQFLLLGFVVGGIIFSIPRNTINEDYLKLAGLLCILGSSIMISIFGFGIAAKAHNKDSFIILIISQIGLSLFYTGIATAMIEMMKEIWRICVKFWQE